MKLTAKPLLTSAALLLALAASPAASASQPAPLTPAAASAESNPLARWHDRILPRSPRHARQSSTPTEYGGSYKARGATLRIFTAASYGDGAEVRASRVAWADYFASLPHSSELDRLTVVISPFGEMQTSCGGEADSCYSPGEGIIYLVGETPPDGSDIRQIAAHEYGHHIATNRDNWPWDAEYWGPKYWASARQVCANTRTRLNSPVTRTKPLMFPGDQGANYNDNPAEVWAETYRIIASNAIGVPADPWEYDPAHTPPLLGLGLNPAWKPTAEMLVAAQRDVAHPWPGERTRVWKGKFRPGGRSAKVVDLPLSLDGRVTAKLETAAQLTSRIQLQATAGRRLTHWTAASHTPALKNDVCGVKLARVRIARTAGAGSWKLTVTDAGS